MNLNLRYERALQNQIDKANLEIKSLKQAFECGEITLTQLVQGEEKIGKQYTKWAESLDNSRSKHAIAHEIPFSCLIPQGQSEAGFVDEVLCSSNRVTYKPNLLSDLMHPPISDVRYSPEEFLRIWGPNHEGVYPNAVA